jgi:hypothetical protein
VWGGGYDDVFEDCAHGGLLMQSADDKTEYGLAIAQVAVRGVRKAL